MLLRGRLCETGRWATVTLEGERIASVEAEEVSPSPRLPVSPSQEVWIAPGFIDLQLNGYGGDDFNAGFWTDEAASEASIYRIVERAARAGTTQLLPTICTNAEDAMLASLRAVAEACDADARLARAIPAVHVEGPWIASEDGPRGAHPLEHVRDPDWDEFERMQEAAGGRIRLLTLAPERDGAITFIERATEAGVVIALGHTGANEAQIRDAVKAGAQMSTHLGNGAHAVLPRHPNYLWEQLACDALTASVIADSHHLPPSVLKSVARVKGPDRFCLVSDAVALGGLPPGLYNNGRHEVLPSGKVVLAGTPYLAGAGHLLDTCVAHALRTTDLGMEGIAQAASTVPARLLGLEGRKGRVRPDYDADLTLFRQTEDGPLAIVMTVQGGETVYRSE